MWILAVVVVGSILDIIPKIGNGISGLWFLATILPTLGVTARRLHDTGKTAWLILLSLIPIIGNLIVLILCIPEGTNGDNQYGPLPAAKPVEE